MILYHGSSVEVQKPEIYTNGHFKDFGYGFYLTNLEKQARRWAITRRPGGGVVNVYEFEQKKGLGVLKFDEMTESWLDFVVACRRGAEHGYDIVEGPGGGRHDMELRRRPGARRNIPRRLLGTREIPVPDPPARVLHREGARLSHVHKR